jgi:hypothetical protein
MSLRPRKLNILAISAGMAALSLATMLSPAQSASSFSSTLPPPPPPKYTPPPPPVYNPPPPQTPPPHFIPPPPSGDHQTFSAPFTGDLTTNGIEIGNDDVNAGAMNGIEQLSDNAFPSADSGGSGDFFVVRGDGDSVFHKDSPWSATVESGQVMVSMRRPTRLGLISTQLFEVALTGDADVVVIAADKQIRLVNIGGRGEAVKVKFARGRQGNQNANVIALAPGYELVVADHALSRSDVRPADGFARRNFQLFADGKAAVCEISAESVLASSTVIARVAQDNSDKERRVLHDMCKMAAVLNYVNGTQGFASETPSSQVAHR